MYAFLLDYYISACTVIYARMHIITHMYTYTLKRALMRDEEKEAGRAIAVRICVSVCKCPHTCICMHVCM